VPSLTAHKVPSLKFYTLLLQAYKATRLKARTRAVRAERSLVPTSHASSMPASVSPNSTSQPFHSNYHRDFVICFHSCTHCAKRGTPDSKARRACHLSSPSAATDSATENMGNFGFGVSRISTSCLRFWHCLPLLAKERSTNHEGRKFGAAASRFFGPRLLSSSSLLHVRERELQDIWLRL
jgi:hypothetical protein